MKALVTRYRLVIALTAGLIALLLPPFGLQAQHPVPHAVEVVGEDCLSCHQSGAAGAPRMAGDHLGRENQDCLICHQVSGAMAADILHPVIGREDCLSCHGEGQGGAARLAGNHVEYVNEDCSLCHLPSPDALEPSPTPSPEESPASFAGVASCAACHQLIFADEAHLLFTDHPTGDPEAGASLFGQSCAGCHGEDGSKPVGDSGLAISAEPYWSTHDDATILLSIGAGAQGRMLVSAKSFGGALSWEEVLDLVAYVRSWGPVAPPSGAPTVGGPNYVDVIGPLLVENCGGCHGGTAGLTVTDYPALLEGSSSGPVLVSGDPDASLMVQVLREGHFAQLGHAELGLLVEWIANGAPVR